MRHDADATKSPTMSLHATESGIILGQELVDVISAWDAE